MMVEAGANEVPEEKMLQAILYAHEEIKKLVAFQEGIVAEIGKEKREFPLVTVSDEVAKAVREFAFDKVVWAFDTFDRAERTARENQVKQETLEHFAEQFPDCEGEIGDAALRAEQRGHAPQDHRQGHRPDGRELTQVRPIWCEVGLLPRAHGSAVFTRARRRSCPCAPWAP